MNVVKGDRRAYRMAAGGFWRVPWSELAVGDVVILVGEEDKPLELFAVLVDKEPWRQGSTWFVGGRYVSITDMVAKSVAKLHPSAEAPGKALKADEGAVEWETD